MSDFTVARLDDIPETSDGRSPWRPVRHHLGITAFGVNVYIGHAAGDRVINEHDEADDEQEELYLVLSGRATFELGEERREAPAGTLVFVRAGVRRTAFADEDETAVLALGGVPGKAYEPHGYDVWAPANPLYQAGEYAAAADRAKELIEANPQYAGPFYNLACCESLAGRPQDAIEHLRHAVEMSASYREYARQDSDFDPIRGEPAFAALVGEAT